MSKKSFFVPNFVPPHTYRTPHLLSPVESCRPLRHRHASLHPHHYLVVVARKVLIFGVDVRGRVVVWWHVADAGVEVRHRHKYCHPNRHPMGCLSPSLAHFPRRDGRYERKYRLRMPPQVTRGSVYSSGFRMTTIVSRCVRCQRSIGQLPSPEEATAINAPAPTGAHTSCAYRRGPALQ